MALIDDLQGRNSICPPSLHFRERLVKSRDWSRLWCTDSRGRRLPAPLCVTIARNHEVVALPPTLLAIEINASYGYSKRLQCKERLKSYGNETQINFEHTRSHDPKKPGADGKLKRDGKNGRIRSSWRCKRKGRLTGRSANICPVETNRPVDSDVASSTLKAGV